MISNRKSKTLNEIREQPLFICGHPKAGTSLLRAVFDSHPQLIVYPEETIFFRRYLPQAIGLDLEGQIALAERTLIHIFRWNSASPAPDQEGFPDRDYSTISYEAVRQRMVELVTEQHRQPGDMLSAAVLAFGQVNGQLGDQTRRWVEKSPYNEYYTDRIFEWWPVARCIHILRDPRDNYVSYRRKHPDWSAEFFAANWKHSTQTGIENRRRYGAGRYYILRYEDLTQAPEEHLQKLADFLQIEWDASLAAPTRAGEQWSGNSMFSGAANEFKNISAAPVGRWKEKLSLSEALVIEMKIGKLFESCGYQASALQDANAMQRLAANWRLASWPIRRRLGNLGTKLGGKTKQEDS
jgi:protein-tyrosine sulfotransferase